MGHIQFNIWKGIGNPKFYLSKSRFNQQSLDKLA